MIRSASVQKRKTVRLDGGANDTLKFGMALFNGTYKAHAKEQGREQRGIHLNWSSKSTIFAPLSDVLDKNLRHGQ